MNSREKTAALLVLTENIEMKLFSSEESCQVVTTQEKLENYSLNNKGTLEHPLVPECEKNPRSKTEVCVQEDSCSHPPAERATEIEMEVFPPIANELVEINSSDSSILTPFQPSSKKSGHLKWKPLIPQRTKLTVKDVICLPRGHYTSQQGRQMAPETMESAPLFSVGLSARITIDHSWSEAQMERRLHMLFSDRFGKQEGQKFTFTYLQCVQGSRVLFVPDRPPEGWTGDQVLRLSGLGPLYIFSDQESHQDGDASEAPLTSDPLRSDGGTPWGQLKL